MLSHKTGDCRLAASALGATASHADVNGMTGGWTEEKTERPPRGCGATSSSVAERVRLGNPSIEFGHRLPDRIAPTLVCGRLELTREFRPRKPQRFERPHPFRIAYVAQLCLRALALQFLHAFLDPRILIDKSFAGITHMFTL